MHSSRIKILLVDDHAVVRQGYRSLLERQPDIEVVAEAADGDEAYVLFRESNPDIVIMDLSMPGRSGIETITRIHQRDPRAVILVFTMHQDPLFAQQAMRAGARGYVTKSSTPDVLVHAVYEVYHGRHALSPDIAQALALSRLQGGGDELDCLTPREFEIFRMLVEAHSTDEIAAALHISPKTVANIHYEIKRKLGVKNDIGLLHLAFKYKVLELPAADIDR